MDVSLILCTKNGGDKLNKCLAAIEGLDAAVLDCHLVDNGSTDGVSYEALHRFAAASRFDVRVYQTFKRGNSAGRNVAIPHASGQLVLFIDDDCYPDPSFVADWVQVFQEPGVGYASGTIAPFDRNYSYESCNEYPHDRYMAPRQFVWRGFMTGSNMALSKACLNSIGLFDERLGAGTPFAAEDWDMSLRASAKGWKGRYSPVPRVAHDHRRTEDEAAGRWRFYDYGAGAVYAKHTFTGRGIRIMREFLRELARFAHDSVRRGDLLAGYFDFLRNRPRAR